MSSQRLTRNRWRSDRPAVTRAVVLSAVVTLLVVVTTASAQTKYPVYTPEHFIASMQNVGLNFPATSAFIADKDFPAAKAQLIRTRERLALTITFWRDRQKDDALKILRDSLAQMDELDGVLSKESVDSAAAGALAKQIGANCQACHALYRDQDASTRSYRFKAGLVQ